MRIKHHQIRLLNEDEVKKYDLYGFCWVVTREYSYENGDDYITVPIGFLTDGASSIGPDTGCSWIFHDYLYATHKFSDGRDCSREAADQVMVNILHQEAQDAEKTYQRLFYMGYKTVVSWITYYNVFSAFSSAWESSGARGCLFLEELREEFL